MSDTTHAQMVSDWETIKGYGGVNDLPRMSDDDLKEFVLGWCDGRLFSSNHMDPNSGPSITGMVFMPLVFGALRDLSEEGRSKIGLIWEWLKDAGPSSINGYPVFFSCRIMHKDDWARAVPAIQKELGRRKEIEI